MATQKKTPAVAIDIPDEVLQAAVDEKLKSLGVEIDADLLDTMAEMQAGRKLEGLQDKARKRKREKKFVKLIIQKSADRNSRNRPVFVGAQGKGFYISRGVPVIVPEIVANILQDSVETHYEWDKDVKANIAYDQMPYPFAILERDLKESDYKEQAGLTIGKKPEHR